MSNLIIKRLAEELNVKISQVKTAVELIDEGNTIPFIARYRKEATENLDDVVLRDLNERLAYLRNLEKRKEEVIRLIEEQGKLTDELKKSISQSMILQEVEDLYLPYRQKRKTRASIARERGLEPLADLIYKNAHKDSLILLEAEKFIIPEMGVEDADSAVQGAMDIISENISDNALFRKKIREMITNQGIIETKDTKNKSEDAAAFEMYFDFKEMVSKIANHRVLAINRGEKKKFLSVKIDMDEDKVVFYLEKQIVKNGGDAGYLKAAIRDAYRRLIFPSIEREIRNTLTERADKSAIKVFAENLKKYLMQPPVKGKAVMGYDPAFRTGCKIAVVDQYGEFLSAETVYPTAPQNKEREAGERLMDLIKKYNVDLIAIGNGTASRESEAFVAELIKTKDLKVEYIVVNEAGASVYSASVIGNEEFPELNVSLRGAVSIARRLQDPLAELVKIDPKHIGVGQYQHDVDQKELAKALDGVIEDAVNSVGVDINSASTYLLSHISGLNKTTAQNIIEFKRENGAFTNRSQILKVKKIGQKAYEQCAGFLRISNGDNPLDNSSLHPESYPAAKSILKSVGQKLNDFKTRQKEISAMLENLDMEKTAAELGIGTITLTEILKEMKKPGRDPREVFQKPVFKSEVMEINDLKPGMVLTGTIRNVIDFGVFVDIGVHQDGLVHISQMSNKFIKNPMEIASVGDIVSVKVMEVDLKRKRIALSMKDI
ncbi:MAG: RNA-binding transcriptional accessory protein [Eubacteriaceae bacterium]|nr:RNA-binding transcriptional accessory protein [Eubacteriaceae bacterium]